MRVLVLGSGVIGTASAYYLARQGFEVTVVDRQPAVAMETSFANAGQISPGYASPWAAPGVPLKAIKWLLERHAPLAIKLTGDVDQYLWMAQMLRNCTANRYAVNKERMVRLSEYSRDCLDELRAETGLSYENRALGTTQLFRTQAQLDAAAKDIAVLEQSGVPYELLDRDGIARVEPALAGVTDILAGALRLPNDQTGDCQLFTKKLAEMAIKLGVEFRFGQDIQRLDHAGDRINGVWIDGKLETADRYVLALGSYSPQMLKPLGIKAPVYPLKGYSLTVPITDTLLAIVRRKSSGVPIFSPDKNHLHHRLLAKGLNQKQVVLVMYALTAFFSCTALIVIHLSLWIGIAIVAIALVLFVLWARKLGVMQEIVPSPYQMEQKKKKDSD